MIDMIQELTNRDDGPHRRTGGLSSDLGLAAVAHAALSRFRAAWRRLVGRAGGAFSRLRYWNRRRRRRPWHRATASLVCRVSHISLSLSLQPHPPLERLDPNRSLTLEWS